MEKLNMETIYEEFNVKTEEQKYVISELVYLIIKDNAKITNYTTDKDTEIRKVLFGDAFGSLYEKVLRLAGSWSNDLAYILSEDLNIDGDCSMIFKNLFDLLHNKEVVDGVYYSNTK